MYSFRKNSNDEVVVKFCLYSCPQVIPRGLFLENYQLFFQRHKNGIQSFREASFKLCFLNYLLWNGEHKEYLLFFLVWLTPRLGLIARLWHSDLLSVAFERSHGHYTPRYEALEVPRCASRVDVRSRNFTGCWDLKMFSFYETRRESLERLSIDSLTQVGGPLTVIRSCYGDIAICWVAHTIEFFKH